MIVVGWEVVWLLLLPSLSIALRWNTLYFMFWARLVCLYVARWPASGEKLSIFEFANSLSHIGWGAAKQLYFRSQVYELQTQTAFIWTVGNCDSFLFWFRFNIPPSQCFWGKFITFSFLCILHAIVCKPSKTFYSDWKSILFSLWHWHYLCEAFQLNREQPPSEPNTAHTKSFYQPCSTDTK